MWIRGRQKQGNGNDTADCLSNTSRSPEQCQATTRELVQTDGPTAVAVHWRYHGLLCLEYVTECAAVCWQRECLRTFRRISVLRSSGPSSRIAVCWEERVLADVSTDFGASIFRTKQSKCVLRRERVLADVSTDFGALFFRTKQSKCCVLRRERVLADVSTDFGASFFRTKQSKCCVLRERESACGRFDRIRCFILQEQAVQVCWPNVQAATCKIK